MHCRPKPWKPILRMGLPLIVIDHTSSSTAVLMGAWIAGQAKHGMRSMPVNAVCKPRKPVVANGHPLGSREHMHVALDSYRHGVH